MLSTTDLGCMNGVEARLAQVHIAHGAPHHSASLLPVLAVAALGRRWPLLLLLARMVAVSIISGGAGGGGGLGWREDADEGLVGANIARPIPVAAERAPQRVRACLAAAGSGA